MQQTLLPFNTMTEISVFLIFGLVMQPEKVGNALPEGVVIALGLMLLARPISVLIFQPLSQFNLREALLISWCGLRGAVPLALSFVALDAIPRVPGLEPGVIHDLLRNAEGIVFTAVVVNLLVQGSTLPYVARWLGLQEQTPLRESGTAAVSPEG